jgi:hypothetical protein
MKPRYVIYFLSCDDDWYPHENAFYTEEELITELKKLGQDYNPNPDGDADIYIARLSEFEKIEFKTEEIEEIIKRKKVIVFSQGKKIS